MRSIEFNLPLMRVKAGHTQLTSPPPPSPLPRSPDRSPTFPVAIYFITPLMFTLLEGNSATMRWFFSMIFSWATCCACFGQARADTIVVQQGSMTAFMLNGKQLRPKEMVALMQPYPLAQGEMRNAISQNTVGQVFAFAGGFVAGWFIGRALTQRPYRWPVAALGAGLLGISVPFHKASVRNAKRAVRMYNYSVQTSK